MWSAVAARAWGMSRVRRAVRWAGSATAASRRRSQSVGVRVRMRSSAR
ncbi:hypothetical protein SMD44_02155 [Streptomyces alboflavus]|uniref:Uncharacterized protein n=1 Tax=Streptomyces alboflavus TaxID=67267 RepID=A0A1Z1W8M7_9ACTN|nr:hypothetical protein SMD44_02155 [Streptomyces alboflavus]